MTTHNGDYAQALGGKISPRSTARSPLAVGTPSDEWLIAQARQLVDSLPKPAPKPKPKAPAKPTKPATAKAPSDPRYLDNKKGHPHRDNMARIGELLAQLENHPRYRNQRKP